MKAWCRRCGRQKPHDHFRADHGAVKRLVVAECLMCEKRTGKRTRVRLTSKVRRKADDAQCLWCLGWFRRLSHTPRQVYCQPGHQREAVRARREGRQAEDAMAIVRAANDRRGAVPRET